MYGIFFLSWAELIKFCPSVFLFLSIMVYRCIELKSFVLAGGVKFFRAVFALLCNKLYHFSGSFKGSYEVLPSLGIHELSLRELNGLKPNLV